MRCLHALQRHVERVGLNGEVVGASHFLREGLKQGGDVQAFFRDRFNKDIDGGKFFSVYIRENNRNNIRVSTGTY